MIRPIPLATYRVQLTSEFGFDQAAAIVPYLKKLGVSHLYASPFMKARKGSTHGYDIVDHNVLNPELGGEDGFLRLSDTLKANDIGLILDFVPNHMGVHFADNPWWLDMLEWGKASPFANHFDIDWDTLPFRANGGILVPILGTAYGEALDQGQIEIRFNPAEGRFSAWYFEHRLPIAPQRYSEIIRVAVQESGAADSDAGKALLVIAARFTGLRKPNRQEAPALLEALRQNSSFAAIFEKGLNAYRAGAGRPAQTQALHHLLERQHYKLGHWRLATSEINYRRFFDVNSLAGLRVEDQTVFDSIHHLVKRLLSENRLQGLRLDHIDGLRDPAQYCRRLSRLIAQSRGDTKQPFYLLIEKILAENEKLPALPGVHGTTGYEWLNVITRTMLDGKGLEPLDETWRQASNLTPKLEGVLLDAKRRVLETLLTSEFTVLCRLLARIAGGHYSTRDFSADSLRQALELYILHFPVYRTYITGAEPAPPDRALIEETIGKARTDWFGADDGIFDFLRQVLTLDLTRSTSAARGKPRIRRFAFKVQQFTGPMMAKSLEDTSFYRFHRLLALNEVGGDPAAQALTADEFHTLMRGRCRHSPHGMTATATHDTKRGEDARTRLIALTELPGEWASLVGRWKTMNARHVAVNGEHRSPSVAFEYLLYQSLIGAWPDTLDASFIARFSAFAIKAAREAKLETSWLNPGERYEKNLVRFIERILDPALSDEFITSINEFARRTSLLGALGSLAQVTLKTMMPGVPDFYQGTEYWDTSLVDPDNRRPVDFDDRSRILEEISSPDWPSLAARWTDGHIKLAWTAHLLSLRRKFPDLFTFGEHRPLTVSGAHRDHIVAFARRRNSQAVIVAVATRLAPFTDGGRTWPSQPVQAVLDIKGYSGGDLPAHQNLQLQSHLNHIPAAVWYCNANAK